METEAGRLTNTWSGEQKRDGGYEEQDGQHADDDRERLLANNTATVSSKNIYSAENAAGLHLRRALLGDLDPAVDDRRTSIMRFPSALRDEPSPSMASARSISIPN